MAHILQSKINLKITLVTSVHHNCAVLSVVKLLVLLLKSVPRFHLNMSAEEIIIASYMTRKQLLHGMAMDMEKEFEVFITLNRQNMLTWRFLEGIVWS